MLFIQKSVQTLCKNRNKCYIFNLSQTSGGQGHDHTEKLMVNTFGKHKSPYTILKNIDIIGLRHYQLMSC